MRWVAPASLGLWLIPTSGGHGRVGEEARGWGARVGFKGAEDTGGREVGEASSWEVQLPDPEPEGEGVPEEEAPPGDAEGALEDGPSISRRDDPDPLEPEPEPEAEPEPEPEPEQRGI